jgi:hypothetical protein
MLQVFTRFTASIGGIGGHSVQPLHGSISDDNAIWMLANNGNSPSESRKAELQSEFERIRRDLLAGKTISVKTAVVTPKP